MFRSNTASLVLPAFLTLVTLLSASCRTQAPTTGPSPPASPVSRATVPGEPLERLRLSIQTSNAYPDYPPPADPLLKELARVLPAGYPMVGRTLALPRQIRIGDKVMSTEGTASTSHSSVAEARTGLYKWEVRGSLGTDIEWLLTAVHELNHEYQFRMPWHLLSRAHGSIMDIVVPEPGTGRLVTPDFAAYYLGPGQTEIVALDRLFPALEMAAAIPPELRTMRFGTYVLGSHASQIWGVHGFLLEYSSYWWSLSYALEALPWYAATMPDTPASWAAYATWLSSQLGAFSEFRYWILSWLAFAREHHRDQYERIMANLAFRRAFTLLDDRFMDLARRVVGTLGSTIPSMMRTRGWTVSLGTAVMRTDTASWSEPQLIIGSPGGSARGVIFWSDYALLGRALASGPLRDLAATLRTSPAPDLPPLDLGLQ